MGGVRPKRGHSKEKAPGSNRPIGIVQKKDQWSKYEKEQTNMKKKLTENDVSNNLAGSVVLSNFAFSTFRVSIGSGN